MESIEIRISSKDKSGKPYGISAHVGDKLKSKPKNISLAMLKIYARKIIRNYKAMVIIAISLIAAILIAICVSKIKSRIDEVQITDLGRERLYASYTVGYNDTMWSIAEDMAAAMPEYQTTRTYLKDLEATNKIFDGNIKRGDTIILPYYANTIDQDNILESYGVK